MLNPSEYGLKTLKCSKGLSQLFLGAIWRQQAFYGTGLAGIPSKNILAENCRKSRGGKKLECSTVPVL